MYYYSLSSEVVEDLGDERVGDPRLVLLVRDAHADEAVGADVAVAHVLVLLHALPLRQGGPLSQDLLAQIPQKLSNLFTKDD